MCCMVTARAGRSRGSVFQYLRPDAQLPICRIHMGGVYEAVPPDPGGFLRFPLEAILVILVFYG